MPAKLPPATRKLIHQRRLEGCGHVAISRELGLSRSTVAKYADAADAELEIAETPAAGLTKAEVALLRMLLASVAVSRCSACGKRFVVAPAVVPVVVAKMTTGRALECPWCQESFYVND